MAASMIEASESDGLRHWLVVAGVLIDERGVLLVENQRRDRGLDWSTPGGVVEPGEDNQEALTREVLEETGLVVSRWSRPVYRVEVLAPDLGFYLKVVTSRAMAFSGEIVIDDPDGIVTAARFVNVGQADQLLSAGPRWVSEPLLSYLANNNLDGSTFAYRVLGRSNLSITRIDQNGQEP